MPAIVCGPAPKQHSRSAPTLPCPPPRPLAPPHTHSTKVYAAARAYFQRAAEILPSRTAVLDNLRTMETFKGGLFPGLFVF